MCGKLVVASRQEQVPRLHDLLERGTANGLRGLEILPPERIREFEPHAAGVAALRVPEEGITDYPGVCRGARAPHRGAAAGASCSRGVRAAAGGGAAGNGSQKQPGENLFRISSSPAPGLQADRVARMAGGVTGVRIVPFRGDYYRLRKGREHLVRNLIYPVADPRFPFLGVHFTRMIAGGVEAGPNAVLALSREGYSRLAFDLRDAWDALTFPGLWRFVARHAGMCWAELRRAFSQELFCRSLQTLVPEVQPEDLEPAGAGIRAQAMTPDGRLVEDFAFLELPRSIHVLNAPSPAATACLAIGEEVAGRLARLV